MLEEEEYTSIGGEFEVSTDDGELVIYDGIHGVWTLRDRP